MKPWTYCVAAHNTATESTNRIHDDEVARAFGFRGGLVPGVDVWAYLTRPCVDRWGLDFLRRGRMDARFAAPVYEGESVTASLADDGTLTMVGPDATIRATGSASMVEEWDDVPVLPTAALPDPRPPASERSLAAGTPLGTHAFNFRASAASAYLTDIRENSPLYEGGAVGHPGFLARMCNTILATHVVLGPWIHVGTAAQHRGVVHDGALIETRGIVDAEREHKGHRFVDLTVTISADGAPVYHALHTAIWRPRGA